MKALLSCLVVGLWTTALFAQETHRDLEGPGQHTKFLTPGLLDTWSFTAKSGETVVAYVSSKEFDPVLELAKKGAPPDKPLLSVDDDGNESRFSFRVSEAGDYEIRIHAFQYKGGGNYALAVQRFQPQPLKLGTTSVGTFDHQGKGYHYLSGAKDQILVTELKGAGAESWTMLDSKGRVQHPWADAVLLETAGEGNVLVTGRPNNRYEIVVREAKRRELTADKKLSGRLTQGELDVWEFTGAPGDFIVVDVDKQGTVLGRLIYAPVDRAQEKKLASAHDRPEIQFVPLASRGRHLRFAAVLGRQGRYQLQLRAETDATYDLTLSDPSVPLPLGKPLDGSLLVGGATFFKFSGTPGQYVQATLTSRSFVPALRLLDAHGNILENSEGNAEPGAKFSRLIQQAGTYRLQVASLGDGGGGEFRAELQEQSLKELAVGARAQGTLQGDDTEFWAFQGTAGKTLIVSARAATCQLAVSLRDPSGVELHADAARRVGTDSLFSVKLPKDGKYTLGVSSQRGAGAYSVRLIDGD